MRLKYIKAKELLKDKKAIFGLTSVQQFFAIILGIALLAYVIVVVMGTLSTSTILPASSDAQTVTNETGGYINSTGYTLKHNPTTDSGFASPVIVRIINSTDATTIAAGNYTVSAGGVLKNATAGSENIWGTAIAITYTYNRNSVAANNANGIVTNVSTGISNFFGNISPVYAILAILVIILVLVVLVRVVTGSNAGGREQSLQL